MPRNYRVERDAVIRRWYGGNPPARNPRPHRSWREGPITPADCFGIPTPPNAPFLLYGHCMVWKYSLNADGYGVLTIDGKQESAHRGVFIQTRGQIPGNRQVNHLCNRPYCVQPSHLYAGTAQDNRDDSQIFSKEELLTAPWILLWENAPSIDDPLSQRLLESHRYDGTKSWEPVTQPAQKPLEELTCPAHDFAITMFGGACRICRICDASELDERWMEEGGAPVLIAEICPASQTVLPIWKKIIASEFIGESHLEVRRKAYHRSRGRGSHYLRTCGCDYCKQDRMAFRAAIQPLLTRRESAVLDVCERLKPRINMALEESSSDIMEALAKSMGMDDEQTRALKEHTKDCPNTRHDLVKTSRTLEGELGYLTYGMSEFATWEGMLEDQEFQHLRSRWSFFRVRKEDEAQVLSTVLPVARKTAGRIGLAWEEETDGSLMPYRESKPDLYQDIRWLTRMGATKHVLEHLRHELLGRNSSSERAPLPHSSCASSILETGQVHPFTRDFEDGIGYRPDGG